jgi:hypothetical protein
VVGHDDGLFLDRKPSTLAGVGNGLCVGHGWSTTLATLATLAPGLNAITAAGCRAKISWAGVAARH